MRKAILVIPKRNVDQLGEALALCETAGYRVTRIFKTRYATRVGKGLLEEIAESSDEADTIIFYGNPSPSTMFQLMKRTGKRAIDRVQLILEIFALHAGSREAKLQIEAARIKHEIPLIREYIRRSKMGELPGFLGPGSYAIDAYYKHLKSRMARIRRELERLRRLRGTRRASRERRGFIHAAIVGYASAGKTTLFNRLTGEKKPVGQEYFTTLHPKHKRVRIGGVDVVFVDTVGFIRDIPPEIIEAFYSTLEEITYSDIIIFVVDAGDPLDVIREKVESGYDILSRIGAHGKPLVIALNKVDVAGPGRLGDVRGLLQRIAPGASIVEISALTGRGLERLLEKIVEAVRVVGE
ncbi:MAG: GTPase HflX [Desulfurococcales archaeon]|nr:GTPase HflX [Desulfurococcales archaeon]